LDKAAILDQLIALSRELGRPENDYAIFAEGNTSARIDDETFYVKASGTYLSLASPETFVQVRRVRILELLDCGEIDREGIREHLASAVVGESGLMPSIETVLHAFCLGLPDVNFVGHTHPTAVNAILCSKQPEQMVWGRLCPEEIVYCGARSVYVPYCDPGLPLARELRKRTLEFMEEQGVPPKVILMQNHGFIALGKTPQDVEVITAMGVKMAKIRIGAQAFGGISRMPDEMVRIIDTRPDEAYRQKVMEDIGKGQQIG